MELTIVLRGRLGDTRERFPIRWNTRKCNC